MELDSKTFNSTDQALFSYLSGDNNPIHLDAVAARRTQMGYPIVHGINAVLWAMEAACRREEFSPVSLQVNFLAPIYVGDTGVATLARLSDSQLRIDVSVEGMLATAVTLGLGGERKSASPVNEERVQASDWPRLPVELSLEDIKAQIGAIAFAHPSERLAAVFPALCRSISSKRVAAMVGLSRLVGMICPGLHSILKNCSLDFAEIEGGEVLRYATLEVNERFRVVRVSISGPGIAGEVAAYGRLPPIAQPTIEEIARLVPRGAYAGATVLVVGGSRGLGEVAAKACAAGGAHVLVTYAVGRAEAERVAHEISGHGGICGVHAFDVRADVKAQLSNLRVSPTHLYYFASGPMARRRAKFMSEDVLADFLCFYTKGFLETCNVLLAGAPSRELRAFYPSSVSITNPAKGRTEYAMAKAAGEVLCRNMNQSLPGMHVLCHRLPRLLTDQTATVMPAESSPVLDVMLPIVSEMQSPRKAV